MYNGPRSARISELESIISLADSVFKPRGRSMGEVFPVLFSSENLHNLRIVASEKRPVSLMGILVNELSFYGYKIKIASIGSVCTAPEHRRKGLATKLFHNVQKYLKQRHVPVMLISGRRGLYKRGGCCEFGIVYDFNLSEIRRRTKSLQIRVEEYKPCELDSILRLYQREPVRFLRKREEIEKIMEVLSVSQSVFWSKLILIKQNNLVTAYMLLVREEEDSAEPVQVFEYAGNRDHLVRSISLIKDKFLREEWNFLWSVPHQDKELIQKMQQMSIPARVGTVRDHTIKILNFPELMISLSGYIAERIEGDFSYQESPEGFIIRKGKDNHCKQFIFEDLNTLHFFIFGRRRKRGNMKYKGDPELLEELNKCFPLPTILPGMNYI